MFIRIFYSSFFLTFSGLLFGQGSVFVVINTQDAGTGSFRQAVENAAGPGEDTIVFAIPILDPGFDTTTGVWSIESKSTLQIPEGTVIYGGIAFGSGNDPRPGIEIHGNDSLITLGITGLRLQSNVTLRGLVVNRFQYGIWIESDHVTVENCIVGTDPTGFIARPNGNDGILLANGAKNCMIRSNLISGNESAGVRLFGQETTDNFIIGNLIGVNREGSESIPNLGSGIRLHASVKGTTISENLISGNNQYGIWLTDTLTSGNRIENNRIGTDPSGLTAIPNNSFGIAIFNGPSNNIVGPGNRVAFNGDDGVLVDGANEFSTVGNQITLNSISDNEGMGINNLRGGNQEIEPPVIDSIVNLIVYGSAVSGEVIELFMDAFDEGCCFVGTDTAGSTRIFQIPLPDVLSDQMFLTATATDTLGNTSEFSIRYCLVSPSDFLTGPSGFCQGMSIHLNAGVFEQYRWSNGATTEVITIQTPGLYSVTVTDSVGCTGSDSMTILEYDAPDLTIDTVQDDCALTLLDAGEFDSYHWTNGDSSQRIEVFSAGVYGVMVTDSNGCAASDSVAVESDPLQLLWVKQLTDNPFNPYCDECLSLSLARWMDDPVFVFEWDAGSCNFTDLGFTTIYSCAGDTLQYCYTSIAGVHCDPDTMIKIEDLRDVQQIWQCTDHTLPDCPDDTSEILAMPWLIDTLEHYGDLCDLACAGGNAGNFLYSHMVDTNLVLELRTTCSEVIRRFYDCQGNLLYSCTSFSEGGNSDCDLPYLPTLEGGELIWECPTTTASTTFGNDNFIKLFPTLISDQLFVEIEKEVPVEIVFYDGFGRILQRKFINKEQEEVNTAQWPKGIIYAKIISERSFFIAKLMKFN